MAPLELWAAGQAAFPRGPGFYFSLVKLSFLLIAFLLWIYICNAVQRDSDVANFTAERSNALLLGAGILGLTLAWICPSLWLSLAALTLLVCCAVIAYGLERDRQAPLPWLAPLRKFLQQLFGSPK